MPRGDGTGPAGAGPMTGRAMGYCSGYDAPGFANACFGRGRGRGFRRRTFWRAYPAYSPYPAEPLSKEERKKMLEDERKAIEEELKTVEQEIKELEK